MFMLATDLAFGSVLTWHKESNHNADQRVEGLPGHLLKPVVLALSVSFCEKGSGG